jgi:hypothetical protein
MLMFAVVAGGPASIAQRADSPRPEAVIDTPEFMTLLLKPAYVDVQRAVDKPPADRAEWAATYQKAVRLAETANLLFIRRHAGADTPDCAERSAAARAAGAGVADAVLVGLRNARPQDFEQVKPRSHRCQRRAMRVTAGSAGRMRRRSGIRRMGLGISSGIRD